MGIRSRLYNMGARTARTVSAGRTVGRSTGAVGRVAGRSSGARAAGRALSRNSPRASRLTSAEMDAIFRARPDPRVARLNGAIPMGPGRASGRSSGATAAPRRPRFNNGPGRFPQGRIPAGQPGGGQFRGRNVGGEAILNDMESLRPRPRPGRLQRTGAFAKRHPFMLGGMGVAMGYRGGSQSTGPGATTTNTTGVYQY